MIIGVIGFIGSGKGTVGDILANDHLFVRESFAKPVKDAVAVIFNWPRTLLEGDTDESRKWREEIDTYWTGALGWGVTPRKVLQFMGTEAGRNVFGMNLWTSALEFRINNAANYVITDVRFENEIKAIKGLGGTLIRVKRGDDPKWIHHAVHAKLQEQMYDMKYTNYLDELFPDAEHIHRSEWDWVTSKMDYTITNDGTLSDLQRNVMFTLEDIRSGSA